jgi:hypothetical protein
MKTLIVFYSLCFIVGVYLISNNMHGLEFIHQVQYAIVMLKDAML